MADPVLSTPDLPVGHQAQVEIADGSGTRLIRVVAVDGGGGGGGVLGMEAVGNSLFVEAGIDKVLVAAGTTVVLFTLPAFIALAGVVTPGSSVMSNGEQVTMAALVDVTATTSSDLGHFERRATMLANGLGIVNSQGTDTDTDVTSPPPPSNVGASLGSATAVIAVVGGTLVVQATAPEDVDMMAGGSVSLVRHSLGAPGGAPSLAGAVFTPATGVTAGGTHVAITNASGLSNDVVGVFLDGVPVTSWHVVSDTAIDVISAPGGPGTGDIVIATRGGTATAPNAWTYANPIPVPIALGTTMWWLADTGVTIVGPNATVMTDESAHGRNATGTAAYTASNPAFDNTPSVLSAGAGALGNTTTFAQPCTLLFIGRQTGAAGDCDIIGTNDLTGVHRMSFGKSTTHWYLYAGGAVLTSAIAVDSAAHAFAIVLDGASTAVYMDDSTTPIITGDPGANAPQVAIGGTFTVTQNGEVAEFFIVPGVMSNADIHAAFVYFTNENKGVTAS
jgi:hypothetical protein